MDWKQERDLLIAQTMAFVQSVTGKRPDPELLTAAKPNAIPAKASPVVAAPPAATPLAPPPSAVAPSKVAPLKVTVQASPEPSVAAPSPMPVPTVIEVPPAPADVAEPDQLPHFAKLDIRGDFQSEVRARVASFRENQQRFLKEREEYCSSTMDKVRAAIRDNSELPRSGK
ncbi:hypothetical protein JQ633_21505 [Bradyrhizobium tropiciagri]|uniref:hypothetical protein n=1 Tax=Bradyrhizobium tropiciagri TaxID=312253 RepID=UPI001BA8DB5A|nr:hypothetical protein [Bradyrhizobium tropiciagri]MBR0872950.1 hypothetical protein [Bradyrhizobium tropiciagri]